MQQSAAPPTQAPVVRLVTVKDAAAMLGVSERKVWNLVLAGELPSVRLGDKERSSRRIEVAAVDAYIARLRDADGALGLAVPA